MLGAGGGGGNLTFHGIYIVPAEILYHLASMHLWATLGCGMFSCHGKLV